MDTRLIVVAGATGKLGGRIAVELRKRNARVRAIVRPNSDRAAVNSLAARGIDIVEASYDDPAALTGACRNATCVVSALSGLREVIVDAQLRLLDAAEAARVPRFIPSDFSIDFTELEIGSNRNLDLRRTFKQGLNKADIRATSIFNGAFTDMLLGQAPIVISKFNRILHWGDPNQRLDFTTMDDTASFTADAALDDTAPRFLKIAGDTLTPRGLAAAATRATGTEFKTFRAGSLGMLAAMIKITRTLYPAKRQLYPPWQGMQYLHNMYSGRAKLKQLDNDRYGERQWTSVEDVLRKSAGAVPGE